MAAFRDERMRGGCAGLATLCLAACATPEARVADTLVEAGVPAAAAACFANDVTQRLTLPELSRIAGAVSQARAAGSALTFGQAAAIAQSAGDARTAGIVLTAAARCSAWSAARGTP